jgi:hypothetical protein
MYYGVSYGDLELRYAFQCYTFCLMKLVMEFETRFPILGEGSSAAGTARVGARYSRQINMMRSSLLPVLTVLPRMRPVSENCISRPCGP